jgi:hypothetical protein
MTSVANTHTFSIGRVDLITAMILLLHGELVELTGDVVGGTGIAVPVGVHAIGRHVGVLLLFIFIVGVTVLAFPCLVSRLAADLTDGGVTVSVAAASAVSTATIAASTTLLVASTFAAATIATAASTSTIVAASAVSSTSTGSSIDRAPNVREELDAILIGLDLGVEVAHGEVFSTIDPDGGEEGIVGVVEAGEEILHEFFLVDRPARCSELISESLHLGEELRRCHVVLLRLGEGNAQV